MKKEKKRFDTDTKQFSAMILPHKVINIVMWIKMIENKNRMLTNDTNNGQN